ncbi:MAG: MmgE/PrpD family protein, partial [Draconibacterium sp.]|nr:MmgE/PrpD family protein [Draconibacterium sp.]
MDRRRFLSIAGGVAATGVMPGGVSFRPVARAQAAGDRSAGSDSPEAELARFALAIRYEDLPAEVIASAKRAVLDALGCALAAFGTDAASMAQQTIDESYGHSSAATVIGYAASTTIEGAIFANGVLVRSLDLNDTYIGTDPLHPSELLPIALAACEAGAMTGRQFIEAMVAGYEVATRVN